MENDDLNKDQKATEFQKIKQDDDVTKTKGIDPELEDNFEIKFTKSIFAEDKKHSYLSKTPDRMLYKEVEAIEVPDEVFKRFKRTVREVMTKEPSRYPCLSLRSHDDFRKSRDNQPYMGFFAEGLKSMVEQEHRNSRHSKLSNIACSEEKLKDRSEIKFTKSIFNEDSGCASKKRATSERPKNKNEEISKQHAREKEEVFEPITKIKYTPYYNILASFLENEVNYYYFKRILEETKKELDEITIAQLVMTVFDHYVYNSKYKLANQNFQYVDPTYYAKLLELFAENGLLSPLLQQMLVASLNRMSSFIGSQNEDKSLEEVFEKVCKLNDPMLKTLLLQFLQKVMQSLPPKYKQISGPRGEALDEIEKVIQQIQGVSKKPQISTKEVRKRLKEVVMEKSDYLQREAIRNFKQEQSFETEKAQHQFYFPAKTFALGNFTYSVEYNKEGNLFFKVHLLDTSRLLSDKDYEDDLLKEAMLQGKNIQFHLPFEKGRFYPVWTFHFRIYLNNQVREMAIYPDVIQVEKVYDKKEFDHYRNNLDLKTLVSAYKRMNELFDLDFSFDIDGYTKQLLAIKILEKIQAYEEKYHCQVPLMYQQPFMENISKLQSKNHNEICCLLSKIDKNLAYRIFAALDEVPEDIYMNYWTSNSRLEIDPFSYQTIDLFRIIQKYLINDIGMSEEEYTARKAEITSWCNQINNQNGYIPNKIVKENSKRLTKSKNMIK